MSPEIVAEMRDWIGDCYWDDLELAGGVDFLSDDEVTAGVERHYQGGVDQFMRDRS